MKKITLMLFTVIASFAVNAQQIQGNTDAPTTTNTNNEAPVRLAPVLLTQSVDSETVSAGGVACWSSGSGEYRENSFYRSYDLADFGITNPVVVSSVEFGQGSADEGKELILNLYTVDNVDLEFATTFTLIGTATHIASAANDLSLVSVPMVAVIPAGSIVAFEVNAPDGGTATGQTFFPGNNGAGENAPSYLKAEACGITVPTPVGDIAAPESYVMNVVGDDVLSVQSNLMSQISVYPNPTSSVLNLKVPASVEVNRVSVFDLLGKLTRVSYNNGVINISNLSQGVYLLKVETSAGTLTQKVVKQ